MRDDVVGGDRLPALALCLARLPAFEAAGVRYRVKPAGGGPPQAAERALAGYQSGAVADPGTR